MNLDAEPDHCQDVRTTKVYVHLGLSSVLWPGVLYLGKEDIRPLREEEELPRHPQVGPWAPWMLRRNSRMWTRPSEESPGKRNRASVSCQRIEPGSSGVAQGQGSPLFTLLSLSTALATDCRPWDGTGCAGCNGTVAMGRAGMGRMGWQGMGLHRMRGHRMERNGPDLAGSSQAPCACQSCTGL